MALTVGPIFCFALFFSGCINLKIETPDDPGWGTGFFLITNDIRLIELEGGAGLKEKQVTVSDENVYAVLKIVKVDKKAEIRWVWYGPAGKRVKKSEKWEVNPDGNYLDYFLVWDSLENGYFMKRKGKWTVTVLVDGVYLTSRTFRIR